MPALKPRDIRTVFWPGADPDAEPSVTHHAPAGTYPPAGRWRFTPFVEMSDGIVVESTANTERWGPLSELLPAILPGLLKLRAADWAFAAANDGPQGPRGWGVRVAQFVEAPPGRVARVPLRRRAGR